MHSRASSITRFLCTGVLATLLVGPARADSEPSTALLGKKIEDVAFVDAAGKTQKLDDLKGKKAIVVVFLSFECPIANSYAQPLAELAKTYGARGVAFVGVCATEDEDAVQVAKHAKKFDIPFPVYRDAKYAAAHAFRADITPEAFVLDADGVLRYRGRIDNTYVARIKKNNSGPTRHDLRQALDEVLAGKPVTMPATLPVGCPIARGTAPVVNAAPPKVTYYRDVLPILQNQCQVCHRPDEVAPFALMTYKQAVNWADDIKEFTQNRKMPPWKPVDGPAFQHERKLSAKELATLAQWADNGTPAGDPTDAPPPRRFPSGWQLGTPDLILTVPADYHLGANGNDVFRSFVLPTNLAEDKYVTAVELRPGNPRIVHHALTFIDTTGQARKLEQQEKDRAKDAAEKDAGPGYSASMGIGFLPRGGLGGWAPGQVPHHLPEGTGYFLPKGADVVLQIHYHRDGRDEQDRTSIGLYLAKKPVERRFQGMVIPGRFFMIPAGDASYRVAGGIICQQDCQIHAVTPHMHMLGKEIKITLTPPDGKPQTLLAIKDWDYNWQETYFFKEPIAIKAGTRLDMEAVFDNSAQNPSNPNNPPRAVFAGRQTTNEMCFGFLGATSDQPGRIRFSIAGRDDKKPAPAK